MVAWYRDSKQDFLKKYVMKGHSRDLIPLAGEAYSTDHLDEIEFSA